MNEGYVVDMTDEAMWTGILGLEGIVCSRRFGVEAVGEGGKMDRLVTELYRKASCKVGHGREDLARCSKDSVIRS
jgi:hypothetical protein